MTNRNDALSGYSEKDVENAFAKFLETEDSQFPIKVVGTQIPLPLGRIDVLAVDDYDISHTIYVCEIKKDIVDLATCGQLLGYLYQVECLLKWHERDQWDGALDADNEWWMPLCGIMVGARYDPRVLRILNSKEGFSLYTHEHNENGFVFKVVDHQFLEDNHFPPLDPRLAKSIRWCVSQRAKHSISGQTQVNLKQRRDSYNENALTDLQFTVPMWQAPR